MHLLCKKQSPSEGVGQVQMFLYSSYLLHVSILYRCSRLEHVAAISNCPGTGELSGCTFCPYPSAKGAKGHWRTVYLASQKEHTSKKTIWLPTLAKAKAAVVANLLVSSLPKKETSDPIFTVALVSRVENH